MRFLWVVHRYPPYPGGSEYYVQSMAEEALSRGHEVAVLAGEHQGAQNGVHVTSQAEILAQPWDLIIVHGGDVGVQNFVLQNALAIPSKVLYMIILPSHSPICVKALNDCDYLGWSTPEDRAHIRGYGHADKAVRVRHGINIAQSQGQPGFKAKYNINKRMFLSCGGYWPNKKMRELAAVWREADLQDTVLVTTGYDNRMDLMPAVSDGIMPLLIDSKQDVLSAIHEADCYLMHSSQEGFGLVILESMLNKTPWIARKIAGAALLEQYGRTYTTDAQLINLLRDFEPDLYDTDSAQEYVISNHSIANTIDDIEDVLKPR
jgi:glycosyltransferase involved in cell wall biosynthesis